MYEVLKAGGLTGGFNFDAKNRRPSYTAEDMFYAYILGMDTFALELLKAAKIIEDGRIDAFIKQRYASYRTGIGAKIRSGETTLEELAAHAEAIDTRELPGSGQQEYLESIVNNILFFGQAGFHIISKTTPYISTGCGFLYIFAADRIYLSVLRQNTFSSLKKR